MCGITGFLGPARPLDESRHVLEAMTRALDHRGPDDSGVWIDQDAELVLGLGQTRLSIIDLSPAGHQPMLSADGRFALIYNGEIYNHQDLRESLEARGQAPENGWRGHSDTEVLLQAMAVRGVEAALADCVGMFAIALWDRREQTLTLARDRMGIKPMAYALSSGPNGPGFLFGSELGALRRHPDGPRDIDRSALALFMRQLYIPAPHSIHPGVRKLPPGAILRVRPRDVLARHLPKPARFWSVEDAIVRGLANPLADENEALELLEATLGDAVERRLIADVPLGVFLSGGLDSSTVAALMQARSSRPIRSFSIGAPHPEYDEAPKARAVAEHLGAEHTELYVTAREALDAVPLMPRAYDEPFADASQIPTFLVSRMAREQVTVCLSGDGGDELFGGYNRHVLGPTLWRRLGGLPGPLRGPLRRALLGPGEGALAGLYKLLSPLLPPSRRQALFRDKLRKVALALAARDLPGFYRRLTSAWGEDEPSPVAGLGPDFAFPATLLDEIPELPRGLDPASWFMAMDQLTYLPDDILTKVDRASMAVALEARVPILDHRVVELAWRMPASMKIKAGRGKHILRRLLYKHVPAELVDQPKQGFGIPIEDWLRGPLRDWAGDLLSPERLTRQGWLDPTVVGRAWAEHQAGQNRQHRLWPLLMFQGWLERHEEEA